MLNGYSRMITVTTTTDDAFAAIATVAGIRRWWTPIVAGAVEPAGLLALGFVGLDEAIILRVDQLHRPHRVEWTCLRHTAAPEWDGSRITFDLEATADGRCEISVEHLGVDPAIVEDGWVRFLDSLVQLLETGAGQPYTAAPSPGDALRVAREYHAAWTRGDYAQARRLLADDLIADVPINEYSGGDEFAAAVQGFGGLAERVDVLSEFTAGDEAMLVYDMHTQPLGVFRVAEQFTVRDGLIRRIRHIHDTAAIRGAAA